MKKTLNVILLLLIFISTAGMSCAGLLIISPGGKLMGLPLSVLNGLPFDNFLIPGFLLFIVFGFVFSLSVFTLLKRTAYEFAEKVDSLDYIR